MKLLQQHLPRAAAVLTTAVLAAACATRSDDSIIFTIQQALATAPNGASLDRAVAGDWDRLCIFRPQTKPAVIDSVLGRSGTAAARAGIDRSDTHTLLVFAAGERVERQVMYPREKGDFTAHEGRHCMRRADAVFQMRQPIDGSIPWVGPVRGP